MRNLFVSRHPSFFPRIVHAFLLLTAFGSLLALASCSRKPTADLNPERLKEVVVYAYDSFVSEWGPGPKLTELFQAKTGYKLTLISAGDAAQVLAKAMMEKDSPAADVLVGIDNLLAPKALEAGVLAPYKPADSDKIPENLRLAPKWHLTPYDWGYFAIIRDTAKLSFAPRSLEDLTRPECAKRLILLDPRSSTPGQGFVAWTRAVYGPAYLDYWKRLKPSILTVAPGWDTGYGLFTAGEAPLVISYTTSPAYHAEYEEAGRYEALVFPEGHTAQIEGAGMVSGAPNRKGAQAFLDFLVSGEAQAVIPLTQWMYPVREDFPLPTSYDYAPKADKLLAVSTQGLQEAVDAVISVLGAP